MSPNFFSVLGLPMTLGSAKDLAPNAGAEASDELGGLTLTTTDSYSQSRRGEIALRLAIGASRALGAGRWMS